jgi:UDP-2,4-diacetamido-2,4,6-trideoxy-beta-L-altropyranose hydrolase
MIIFRTNASYSSGMGQLARSRRLANNLNSSGYKVCFVLDTMSDYLSKYLKNFACYSVYDSEWVYLGQEDDAMRFVRLFSMKDVTAVIVDDYRFYNIWENIVRKLNCKIIVIDDQNINNHKCDLLVDSTWEGKKTYERYKDKVSHDSFCLLGPKYLLVDEVFGLSNKKTKQLLKTKPLKILLSLGGGGDLLFFISLIKSLIEQFSEKFLFEISIVIGPYANHQKQLIDFSKKYDFIKVIINKDGLFNEISKTDLYIGSSGGTLFEALALKIPCITFSISENQKNNHSNFEDLGHYFHINDIDEKDIPNFASLVLAILSQYERVSDLYQRPSHYEIDGKGVNRVSKAIQQTIDDEQTHKIDDILKQDELRLDTSYGLKQINDTYINRYLDARNLKINRDKMIDQDPIPRINHYLWWLKSSRRISYALKKNGEDILYIWHQANLVLNENIIISGWFISNKSCSALDAIYAVNEHSKIIDNLFSDFSWIIVMRKDNHFMQKLHNRLEFSIVEKGCDMEKIVQKSFPSAKSDDFLYYFKRI